MREENCKICKEYKELEEYSLNCSECNKKVKDSLILLSGHVSEETAYIVESYPYGRLRTKIRYWIESNKKGDRFLSQTLNPKTDKWNKPKTSTYDDVKIMTKDFRGYISTIVWYPYSMEEFKSFKETVKDFPLNEFQKDKLLKGEAYLKTMENVTVSINPVRYKHKVTGEIKTTLDIMELGEYEEIGREQKEKEQKEIKEKLKRIYSYNLHKLKEGSK